MTLYANAKTSLVDAINTANNTDLEADDYTITPSADSSHPGFNAAYLIQPVDITSSYSGQVTVYAKRLNLADLNTMVNFALYAHSATTKHDLIPLINNRFGLNLTTDDIADGALPTELPNTTTITATAGSLMWYGSATLTLNPGDVNITTLITDTEIDGFNYPTTVVGKVFGPAYSYWRDFSNEADVLELYTDASVVNEALRAAIATITGNAWTLSAASNYSLNGADITYNGPVGSDPRFNSRYDFAMIIALSPTECLNMSGNLIIHYDEYIDPLLV